MKRAFYATLAASSALPLAVDALQLSQTAPQIAAQTETEFIGAVLDSFVTGGQKVPKARMGGLRINAIDANQSEECHGATFQGKTKGDHKSNHGGHKIEDKPKNISTNVQQQPMVGTAMVPMPMQSMMPVAQHVMTPHGPQVVQTMQPMMT